MKLPLIARTMSRGSLAVLPLIAAIVLSACGGNPAGSSATRATGSSIGSLPLASRIIPASMLPSKLASHRPTVLLFMATGCASCAGQVADLQQAMAGHPGVQVIGVDIVSFDNPAILRSFLEAQDLDRAPLLWTIDTDGSVLSKYGVQQLDATIGIDRTGVVRFQNPGAADSAQLAGQLAALERA